MVALTRERILELLEALDRELSEQCVVGELYLVGGAVMCLAHQSRPATLDIDGYFQPTQVVRAAAERLCRRYDLDPKWLNDAVKGFLSRAGDFDPYLEREHLRVFVARPEYLLAMKCLSFRIGAEFHDEADIRYLLRNLNVGSSTEALDIITQYYPLERFPQKTLYALEEIFTDSNPKSGT